MDEKFKFAEKKGNTELSLGTMLDAGSAAEFHQALKSALDTKNSLVLEASDVDRISTAGLQLILAASVECAGNNRRFELKNPSNKLRDGLNDLGLAEQVDSWVA